MTRTRPGYEMVSLSFLKMKTGGQTFGHGIRDPLGRTNRRTRQKSRVNPHKSDGRRLDGLTVRLDLLQRLVDIEYNSLRMAERDEVQFLAAAW